MFSPAAVTPESCKCLEEKEVVEGLLWKDPQVPERGVDASAWAGWMGALS